MGFKRKMKPLDFIYIFGISGAICTLLVVYFTLLHNKSSSDKSTTTLNNTTQLLQENNLLKDQVRDQSTKIDELRRENTELSSKLMDKSLDIFKNLTGNEEKPILHVIPTHLISENDTTIPKYFLLFFSIENRGKYPMRNMRIRISDFLGRDMILYGIKHFVNGSSFGACVRDKESEYKNFNVNPNFDIGTLSPNVNSHIYRTTYPPKNNIAAHYNVEIMWDGGYLYHFITFKTEGEKLILDHWEALFNGKPFDDASHIQFN